MAGKNSEGRIPSYEFFPKYGKNLEDGLESAACLPENGKDGLDAITSVQFFPPEVPYRRLRVGALATRG